MSAPRICETDLCMAPVVPNPKKIRAFRSEAAFEAWLRANHARETEIWLRIYKKGAGKPTVTNKMIVQHMVLDAGQAETLRQLSMKVTAKTTPPQVNTAAAGKR